MYEAGIKKEDMLNKRHNVFLTFQEVQNRYLLHHSNLFYRIIECIPHAWT